MIVMPSCQGQFLQMFDFIHLFCVITHYLLLSNANQVEWHNKVVEPLFVLTKLIQKSN